jgi:hypothetical protein
MSGRWSRAQFVWACAFVVACSSGQRRQIPDPVPDVPVEHQSRVSRSDLQWRWPFTVGAGTLACESGAVMFRSGATTYALNDAAQARGFIRPDAIRTQETAGPPRNPLGRIKQDTRMGIFAQSAQCGRRQDAQPDAANDCRSRIKTTYSLSDSDLAQIDAEGEERFWKPLTPPFRTLAPVVEMGLKLCQ